MDEPTARLGLPMATAAMGGAAIASSMTRWWLMGPLHGPVALTLAAAVGAWFGAMLSYSLRADPPRLTLMKAAWTAAVAGPVTALVITAVCDQVELGAATAWLGAVFAIVMLPCVLMVVHLARAAARSRERSIVGQSDRRAAWRATSVWLALVATIGTMPALVDGSAHGFLADTFWWRMPDKEQLARAPLLVSLVACVIAAVCAVSDARSERLLAGARKASGGWRIELTTVAMAGLDVGIGFDAWMEHVSGRATYRDHARERVAAFGDLDNGYALLRSATRRSAVALAIAGAAELAALVTYARLL